MVDGKTVGGKTTTYIYNAGMLLAEDNPDYRINFYYDSNGIATEIGYIEKAGGKFGKETFYFFTRNGQGDIVGVYRSADSTLVGRYEYDLWGNPVSVIENTSKKVNGKTVTIRDEQGILEKNPLRYRGYYYDKETGFYYLNARYYDPKVHRFITPEPNFKVGKFDKNTGLNAYNLFAYCGNDPINLADQTGEFVITTTMIVVGVCAVAGMTVGGIIGNVKANNKGLKGWDKAKYILTGMALGGLAGGLIGYGAGMVLAPIISQLSGYAGFAITSSGIVPLAANGTDFGKLGILIENTGNQIIDWTKTTIHGLQRMAERNVSQADIELWVRTGKALQQSGDKIAYVTRQGFVVINSAGKVVTTYASQYYDDNMKQVIIRLFGSL